MGSRGACGTLADALRRRVKVALASRPEDDLLPARRELSDPWTMAKDGKIWLDPDLYPKDLREVSL